MRSFSLLVPLLYLPWLHYPFSNATDTIKPGQWINGSKTIVSAGGNFELGFFSPPDSNSYYVGIWYKKVSFKTVVWVANRENPVSSSSSFLTINNDGNLIIVEGRLSIALASRSSPGKTSAATLLDSGNLVLRDNNSDIWWQSFDYPCHTFLPGMKMGYNKKTGQNWSLTSWRSLADPAPGGFNLVLDPAGTSQFFIMKENAIKYWTSGPWNGRIFSLVPEMRLDYIFNFSFYDSAEESYFTYSLYNSSILSRLVMDLSGQIKQYSWLEGAQQWYLFWRAPRWQCDVFNQCGPFGVCQDNSLPFCGCLKGFEPRSLKDWNHSDWSSGCVRTKPLRCESDTAPQNLDQDRFLQVYNVRLPMDQQYRAPGIAKECESVCLNNCSCTAYTYSNGNCSLWYGNLSTVEQLSEEDAGGEVLFLRLAASEFPKHASKSDPDGSLIGNKIRLGAIVAGLATAVLLLVSYLCYRWRRKLQGKEKWPTSQDLLLFDFGSSIGASGEHSKEVSLGKRGSEDVQLPLFSFTSVSAATNNFSAANKLGEGGFGPVYKGKLLKGQEIAVKRLSRRSGQGLEELKNETILIAKLQHRNLVRLLGCCIERDEKILIYEYMANKSLDFFLFDPTKRWLLDLRKRAHIIEGIGQGLLYLHQYSRLRIIHRDLKASNILLDSDMTPKISDFGMARIFGGNESQANTNRIVGTYGYMSPEYAIQGLFSTKSDVFSFGVLMLEILTGKRNTGFYSPDSVNLIGYAWELWKSDKGLELMDPILGDLTSMSVSLRYINVALLCVEESATDRPTMSDVVLMLSNELAVLPSPKQPAFCNGGSLAVINSDMSKTRICSTNNVTVSTMEGR
nr:TPA_asm: hypothetical protein HUJ06_024606 [Nelumbo nucifera]